MTFKPLTFKTNIVKSIGTGTYTYYIIYRVGFMVMGAAGLI